MPGLRSGAIAVLAASLAACCLLPPRPRAARNDMGRESLWWGPASDASFPAAAPPATLGAVRALAPGLSIETQTRRDLLTMLRAPARAVTDATESELRGTKLGHDPLTATLLLPVAVVGLIGASDSLLEVRISANGALVLHGFYLESGPLVFARVRRGAQVVHFRHFWLRQLQKDFVSQIRVTPLGADGFEGTSQESPGPEATAALAEYAKRLGEKSSASREALAREAFDWFGTRALPGAIAAMASAQTADADRAALGRVSCDELAGFAETERIGEVLAVLPPRSVSSVFAILDCQKAQGEERPERLRAALLPLVDGICRDGDPRPWLSTRSVPRNAAASVEADAASCPDEGRRALLGAFLDLAIPPDGLVKLLRGHDGAYPELVDQFSERRAEEALALEEALRAKVVTPYDRDLLDRLVMRPGAWSPDELGLFATQLGVPRATPDHPGHDELYARRRILETISGLARTPPGAQKPDLAAAHAELRRSLATAPAPESALVRIALVLMGDVEEALPAARELPENNVYDPQGADAVRSLVRQAFMWAGCQENELAGARRAALAAPASARGALCTRPPRN